MYSFRSKKKDRDLLPHPRIGSAHKRHTHRLLLHCSQMLDNRAGWLMQRVVCMQAHSCCASLEASGKRDVCRCEVYRLDWKANLARFGTAACAVMQAASLREDECICVHSTQLLGFAASCLCLQEPTHVRPHLCLLYMSCKVVTPSTSWMSHTNVVHLKPIALSVCACVLP